MYLRFTMYSIIIKIFLTNTSDYENKQIGSIRSITGLVIGG